MPKVVNHEEYREELLKNSFELFARKGYDSVTMREIARELGISTGTLYHYFPNKSSIFGQMIELLNRNRILQILDNIEITDNPSEKARTAIENVLAAEKFFQDLLFLLLDYYRKNDSQDPENFIGPILKYYRESVMKNLNIPDPARADLVISFIIGLIVQRMVNPDVDVASHIETFLLMLENISIEPGQNLDYFLNLQDVLRRNK